MHYFVPYTTYGTHEWLWMDDSHTSIPCLRYADDVTMDYTTHDATGQLYHKYMKSGI